MNQKEQYNVYYICDRCGTCGEKNSRGLFDDNSLHIRNNSGHLDNTTFDIGGSAYDLCSQCAVELKMGDETEDFSIQAH